MGRVLFSKHHLSKGKLDSTLPAPMVAAGRMVGNFEIIELVGHGGMGEVWLAEQKLPVRRRVALELIKGGMDTREVVARFESERQALALMDHPAIAKIFDGGSTARKASRTSLWNTCRGCRLPNTATSTSSISKRG